MRLPTFLASSVAILVALAVSACGSDGGGGGGAGGGDCKVHPAGNGQHQSEADACDALADAQNARSKAMECTTTLRPCPTLLQVMAGGTTCLEYDQGSVQGCVDYYNQQTTCEDLAKAIDACVVTAFTDSAPNGCP
jgi:hypothetical protein